MALLAEGQTGEWFAVSREVVGPQFYCSYTESGCPCCTCDADSAVRITYSRIRWSKSGKRHTPETLIKYVCVDHIGEEIL